MSVTATGGDLITFSHESHIYVNAPGVWTSTFDNIKIDRDLHITRDPNKKSLFTIYTMNHLECSSFWELTGPTPAFENGTVLEITSGNMTFILDYNTHISLKFF